MTVMERAYLDHNASSPLRPEARAAVLRALDLAGNASSVHAEGRAARHLVEESREALAAAAGVRPEMVMFTSGGTEANAAAVRARGVDRLIVSAIEHPSVAAAAAAAGPGKPVTVAPATADGVVDLEALERLLAAPGGRALVCVMLANNETGVIQPVREAAEIVHRHGGLLHVDAAQGLGRVPVRFPLLDADILTLSAHKCGGPKGAGAAIVRDGVDLLPLIPGTQENRRRGGSENLPAIAGFAAAATAAAAEDGSRLAALRDRLEQAVRRIAPDAVIFGEAASRLPNTSCFSAPGLSAETALISLDLDGVAVSSGAACTSGKVGRSAVLAAMGVAPSLADGAIRVSLGWSSSVRDIERFVSALGALLRRTAGRAAA
jgi:cysteine desulfurase